MRFSFLLLIAVSFTADAESFAFGRKAGAPLRDPVPAPPLPANTVGFSRVETGRWTGGPTMEMRVFRRLSFEIDALYRGYSLIESRPSSYLLPDNSSVPE